MKKVTATIYKIIFNIFVLAVGMWTASLTLSEMREILPNDPITPYFALALFDGGAIAWLTAWLKNARGLYQRSIALIMMVLDLVGVVLLSAGRLLGGGQTMTEAPQALAVAVIYGVVFATLANLAAIYAFHTTDPDTIEEIETSILEDTLRDEAMKQAQANIESQAQALGAIMAARATGQLKYRLRLPMAANEAAAVIDVQSEDIPATQPTQQPASLQAPRMIHAKQKQGPNPLGLWIARTAAKARAKLQPKPAAVIYQQTAPAAPALIETPTREPRYDENELINEIKKQAATNREAAPQATEETKQAMNQAAQSAWLYDNSNTAPADESLYHPKGGLQPMTQPEPLQVIEPTNPTQPATGQPAKGE